MNSNALFIRIMDFFTYVLYVWFLARLFTPRFSKIKHIAACVGAVIAGNLLILGLENLHFADPFTTYCCNFLVVSVIFAAAAFKESFLSKLTACMYFISVHFQLTVVQVALGRLLEWNIPGRIGLMQLVAALEIFLTYRFRVRGQTRDEPRLFALVILVSSTFCFFLSINVNNVRIADQMFVLVNNVSLLVMNVMICLMSLSLRSFFQRWKLSQSIQIRQTAETASVKEIDQVYQEMFAYRHETENHIQVLSALSRQKDYETMERYIAQLSQEAGAMTIPVNSGNALINAVLQQKLALAERSNIPVTVSAAAPETLGIDETDLCSLLSNLLDNAIEASQKVAAPHIDILIKPYKNYLRLDISNRVEGDILSANPQLLTGAEEADRGIGLSIVRRIDAKYGSMLELKVENNVFRATTMLKIQ